MAAALDLRDDAVLAALAGDDPAAAALALAALGIAVFPLHTPDGAGGCSCGRACGRDAGKHPRTPNGLLDAATDPATVAGWWGRWPGANVAAATGRASGFWVLDVDPGAGGEASIARLEGEYGELPPTWALETGGGGLHAWFRRPGAPVPCSVARLGPGLDVRGNGGYAVAPPSRHRSGGRYRWGDGWHPAKVPLAPAPAWLLDLAVAPVERRTIPPAAVSLGGRDGGNHPGVVGTPIVEGERNATLASLAGIMRRRGFGEAAILAALLAENVARCRPPLSEAEVAKVARSIARYAPTPGAADLAPAASPPRGGARGGFVEFVGGKAVVR